MVDKHPHVAVGIIVSVSKYFLEKVCLDAILATHLRDFKRGGITGIPNAKIANPKRRKFA